MKKRMLRIAGIRFFVYIRFFAMAFWKRANDGIMDLFCMERKSIFL
jgi:hypothetical protein